MTSSAKPRRAAIAAIAVPTPPAPTSRMRMSWILTLSGTKSTVDTDLLLRKPLQETVISARTVAPGTLEPGDVRIWPALPLGGFGGPEAPGPPPLGALAGPAGGERPPRPTPSRTGCRRGRVR